jgi:hypothetical protein
MATAIVLGTALEVWAQTESAKAQTEPAKDVFGLACEIALDKNGINPPGGSLLALNSQMHCAGSASKRTITLTCNTAIPNWSGGTVNLTTLTDPEGCQVFGDPCGLQPGPGSWSGFWKADKANLSINTNGNVTLFCQCNPPACAPVPTGQ